MKYRMYKMGPSSYVEYNSFFGLQGKLRMGWRYGEDGRRRRLTSKWWTGKQQHHILEGRLSKSRRLVKDGKEALLLCTVQKEKSFESTEDWKWAMSHLNNIGTNRKTLNSKDEWLDLPAET